MSFLCSRVPSRIPHDIQSPCFLSLFLAMTVSPTSLTLDECDNSEALARRFVKCLSVGTCRMFLSWLDGLWALGRKAGWQSVILTASHQGFLLSAWQLLQVPPMPGAHFPFSVLDFLEKSYYAQLTLKKWRVMPPWGQNISINCFKFFCMEDLSPPCLFIYFKISTHQSATDVIWVWRNV